MADLVKWYKPALWKRILGRFGFKKFQINYVYGIDFGSGDMTVECSGYYDSEGVLNITSLKTTPNQRG